MTITSPSRSAASGPPSAASGATCPTIKPRVPPLKRPSVKSATLSPRPSPTIAAVTPNISRIPGPPRGPSYRMTTTSPATILRSSIARIASSSRSKTRAGPRWCSRSWPAILTTAPSGASIPRRMTRPPVGLKGRSAVAITTCPGVSTASLTSSPRLRPVGVAVVAWTRRASTIRFAINWIPPALSTSSAHHFPPGRKSAMIGVRWLIVSKSSIESGTSASRAIASRWRTLLVEPPVPAAAAIAFSNASRVQMSRGFTSRRKRSIASRPARNASSRLRGSVAPGLALPTGESPMNSSAGAGAGVILDRFELGVIDLSHRVRSDGFENVDDRQVFPIQTSRCDRASVEDQPRDVQAQQRHPRARDRLVAADDANQCVKHVAAGDQLDRIGDELSADQRAFHPLRPHRDAVADRDRIDLHRGPPGRTHARFDVLGELAMVEVARHRLDPLVEDADDRLFEILVGEADRFVHRASRCAVASVGNDGAAGLDSVGHRVVLVLQKADLMVYALHLGDLVPRETPRAALRRARTPGVVIERVQSRRERIAAALRAIVPGERTVLAEVEDLIAYGYDGTWFEQRPLAVVLPETTAQVAQIHRLATAERIPITPRGMGSGLSGGSVPLETAIVVNLMRMNRILEIDEINGVAVVQPGVITADLQREVEKRGLFYPPDPSSLRQSAIGGNIAENAGGSRCLKYGVTSDYVQALEVVLPGGEVIRTGGKM